MFGLTVIGTPGHTAGHISLLDPVASVLIAGDALNGDNGGVAGPNPQFSEDHDEALATVGKMAGYEYETVYFGHGEPVLEGAVAAGRGPGREPLTPGCGRRGVLYTPGLISLDASEASGAPALGGVVKPGVHAGLSSRRSRVQIPSSPQIESPAKRAVRGQVAQLGERRSEKP